LGGFPKRFTSHIVGNGVSEKWLEIGGQGNKGTPPPMGGKVRKIAEGTQTTKKIHTGCAGRKKIIGGEGIKPQAVGRTSDTRGAQRGLSKRACNCWDNGRFTLPRNLKQRRYLKRPGMREKWGGGNKKKRSGEKCGARGVVVKKEGRNKRERRGLRRA